MLRADIKQLYPGKQVLQSPLSLSVGGGQCIVLNGPNGSGKSSVLRCMAALKHPFDGEIAFNDQDICGNNGECHDQIGYLSHTDGLPGDWPVGDIIANIIHENAVDHPLWPVINPENQFKTLSAGQQRRVALADLLSHEKSLYLLDEPMASLDHPSVEVLLDILLKLLNNGQSIILATHRDIPPTLPIDQVIRLYVHA